MKLRVFSSKSCCTTVIEVEVNDGVPCFADSTAMCKHGARDRRRNIPLPPTSPQRLQRMLPRPGG
jgi:hypothetical protein